MTVLLSRCLPIPSILIPYIQVVPSCVSSWHGIFLHVSLSNSLDSLSSLYLGDCAPEIVDDITPPNCICARNTRDIKNAGYSPSAIENAVKPDVDYNHK